MAGIRQRLVELGTAASSSKIGGVLYHVVCRRIDTFLIPLSKGRLAMGPPGHTVLVTTTGARSGKPRRASLAFMWQGEDMVVVASKGGAPRHPGWYYNLKSDPRVRVQYAGMVEERVAREAIGEERDRLFETMAGIFSNFGAYQAPRDESYDSGDGAVARLGEELRRGPSSRRPPDLGREEVGQRPVVPPVSGASMLQGAGGQGGSATARRAPVELYFSRQSGWLGPNCPQIHYGMETPRSGFIPAVVCVDGSRCRCDAEACGRFDPVVTAVRWGTMKEAEQSPPRGGNGNGNGDRGEDA